MTPRQIENAIFVLQVLLPIWIILRSDWRGFFFGVAVQWCLGILALILLAASNGGRSFNVDAFCLLMWLPCLLFCLIVYALKRGIGVILTKPVRQDSGRRLTQPLPSNRKT